MKQSFDKWVCRCIDVCISTRNKLVFNHDDVGHIMGKPSSKVAQKQVDENIIISGQTAFLESRGSKDIVNPYEMRRNKIVAENKAKMRALGLGISQSDGQKEKKKKTKRG